MIKSYHTVSALPIAVANTKIRLSILSYTIPMYYSYGKIMFILSNLSVKLDIIVQLNYIV